jgi:hypothetical protein
MINFLWTSLEEFSFANLKLSAHQIRCLDNPERKLERLKCPGCDKTYFDSKKLNIHLKKNICDGRRAHGRLRSKNARYS